MSKTATRGRTRRGQFRTGRRVSGQAVRWTIEVGTSWLFIVGQVNAAVLAVAP